MASMQKLFVLTAILLIGTAWNVQASLTTVHLSSDADLIPLLTDSIFVAEGRIGGPGTFELDLGQSTSNPEQIAEYAWPNGSPVAFSVSFDDVTNTATFIVGSETLIISTVPQFTDIFIRTRAVNENTSIEVTDLILDGEPVLDGSYAASPNGLDILWVMGGELSDGFTLTGDVVMTWSGAPPSQSRLAFQVKVTQLSTVPAEAVSWGKIKSLFE